DCSRGGLAVAASRMCITSGVGCTINLDAIPGDVPHPGVALFSESHSRYLASIPPSDITEAAHILGEAGVPHAKIGTFGGAGGATACDVMVDKARDTWSKSLERIIHHG
ncbi:MAG: phosphoribosylformylglycinamidine synthase subunit PurL, partial [Nitrosopumilaceae archaeon]|nr:phosphoribosylformylglycinamidine synthase subunit PurL [Nitrosopumilaceae archaeon]